MNKQLHDGCELDHQLKAKICVQNDEGRWRSEHGYIRCWKEHSENILIKSVAEASINFSGHAEYSMITFSMSTARNPFHIDQATAQSLYVKFVVVWADTSAHV